MRSGSSASLCTADLIMASVSEWHRWSRRTGSWKHSTLQWSQTPFGEGRILFRASTSTCVCVGGGGGEGVCVSGVVLRCVVCMHACVHERVCLHECVWVYVSVHACILSKAKSKENTDLVSIGGVRIILALLWLQSLALPGQNLRGLCAFELSTLDIHRLWPLQKALGRQDPPTLQQWQQLHHSTYFHKITLFHFYNRIRWRTYVAIFMRKTT